MRLKTDDSNTKSISQTHLLHMQQCMQLPNPKQAGEAHPCAAVPAPAPHHPCTRLNARKKFSSN